MEIVRSPSSQASSFSVEKKIHSQRMQIANGRHHPGSLGDLQQDPLERFSSLRLKMKETYSACWLNTFEKYSKRLTLTLSTCPLNCLEAKKNKAVVTNCG